MTTSDAAMRSPGARTTPSIKVTVRLNFFIISNPLRFAEIQKAVDDCLPHLVGGGEDEWKKAGCEGEKSKVSVESGLTQLDPLYADSLYVAKND
jgi:hypothetical protein